MIDPDPNHPIQAWGKGAELPDNLSIVADVDEDNFLDPIEEATASTPFVITDLERTATRIVMLAVSQADLVVIPMQVATRCGAGSGLGGGHAMSRANPFGDLDDFSPEPGSRPAATDAIDRLAQASGFPNRKPRGEGAEASPLPGRHEGM